MIALDAISYSNRVRERRVELGIRQAALARLAGISRQSLHGIEAGRMPKANTRAALAVALQCSVDDLFYAEVAA